MSANQAPEKRKYLHHQIDTSSVGLEIGGCVAVGFFIGTWLDGQYDLAPWGMVASLTIGFGAALKGIIRVVKRYRREVTQGEQ